MGKLRFVWRDAKAKSNLQAHGVSFDFAKTAFQDTLGIDWQDDREDYGEDRFVLLGMAEGDVLLYVAYTERDDSIHIISARKATKHEQVEYFKQNA